MMDGETLEALIKRKGEPHYSYDITSPDVCEYAESEYLDRYGNISFMIWIDDKSQRAIVYSCFCNNDNWYCNSHSDSAFLIGQLFKLLHQKD